MLLFVYNANSGKLNTLLDTAHKIVSPSTYQCQLCNLTYGLVRENQQWRQFRDSLSEKVVFLHRDEFLQKFNDQSAKDMALPALLRVNDGKLIILMEASAINAVADTADLISACQRAIDC